MKLVLGLLLGAVLFVAPGQAMAWSSGSWSGHSSYSNKGSNHSYSYKKHYRNKHKNPPKPIPEPGAIALFGAGAVVVGAALRRKASRLA